MYSNYKDENKNKKTKIKPYNSKEKKELRRKGTIGREGKMHTPESKPNDILSIC